MSRLAGTLAIAAIVPLLGAWDILRSEDESVARGNRHFQDGDYGGALERYQEAQARGSPASLHFDLGAALYKLAEGETGARRAELLSGAEKAFRRSADTSDRELKSSAYYNLGNTLFVGERFAAAIDAYKKALRVNPDNDDARYNLELALRKLEDSEPPARKAPRGRGGREGRPHEGDRGEPGGRSDGPDAGAPGGGRGRSPEEGAARPEEPPGGGAGEGTPDGTSERTEDGESPPSERADGDRRGGDGEPSGEEREERERAGPARGGAHAGALPRSEAERKLDELERLSREHWLRRLRERGRERAGGRPEKDW